MSMVKLWPGIGEGLEPLRRSLGALFSEERLGFVTVFVTAVVFETSELVEVLSHHSFLALHYIYVILWYF